ncbi:hypothetical protein CI610_02677 [invertebrate metagenome]|uniref:Uncharacterized protein n=1 Tax=invertebrate metagenome TaxID=1711999 RepID=A0A2H9T5B1_9ZZZZ
MMNLSVTDTQTGQEIWTNSGYSEGRPQDNNFQVTQQLMETLLKLMPIQNQEDNLLPMP